MPSSLRVNTLGLGTPFVTGGNMKLYRVLLPIVCALTASDAFAQSSFVSNLNNLCTSQVPPRGAPNLACNDCHVADRAVNTGRPAYLAYLPAGTTAQKLALCLAATATPTPMPTATPRPTATPMPTATPRPTATPMPTATPAPNVTPMPTATPRQNVTPTPAVSPTPRSRPPRRSRKSREDDDNDNDD